MEQSTPPYLSLKKELLDALDLHIDLLKTAPTIEPSGWRIVHDAQLGFYAGSRSESTPTGGSE